MVVSGERSGKVAGKQKGERGGRAGRGTLRVIVRSGNSQNRESKMVQNEEGKVRERRGDVVQKDVKEAETTMGVD